MDMKQLNTLKNDVMDLFAPKPPSMLPYVVGGMVVVGGVLAGVYMVNHLSRRTRHQMHRCSRLLWSDLSQMGCNLMK